MIHQRTAPSSVSPMGISHPGGQTYQHCQTTTSSVKLLTQSMGLYSAIQHQHSFLKPTLLIWYKPWPSLPTCYLLEESIKAFSKTVLTPVKFIIYYLCEPSSWSNERKHVPLYVWMYRQLHNDCCIQQTSTGNRLMTGLFIAMLEKKQVPLYVWMYRQLHNDRCFQQTSTGNRLMTGLFIAMLEKKQVPLYVWMYRQLHNDRCFQQTSTGNRLMTGLFIEMLNIMQGIILYVLMQL